MKLEKAMTHSKRNKVSKSQGPWGTLQSAQFSGQMPASLGAPRMALALKCPWGAKKEAEGAKGGQYRDDLQASSQIL